MIRIIIACALVSLAAAAAIPDESQAEIVKYVNENDGSGNYNFSYETSNGITRQETGRLVDPGTEDQYVLVQGSFSYRDAEGQLVQVNYSADKDGYHYTPQIGVPQKPGPPKRIFSQNVVASLLGK